MRWSDRIEGLLLRLLNWLELGEERENLLAVALIAAALSGGGWLIYDRYVMEEASWQSNPVIEIKYKQSFGGVPPEDVSSDIWQVDATDQKLLYEAESPEPAIKMTLAEFKEQQRRIRSRVKSELYPAEGVERVRLKGELAEVRRRLDDLPTAYDEAKARISALERDLADLRGEVSSESLAEAMSALAVGDTTVADALFVEIVARPQQSVDTAATAAYARGEIAVSEIRWVDAARSFAHAADLAPDIFRLRSAREFAWLSLDNSSALRFGQALFDFAVADNSIHANDRAIALTGHAITLDAMGRYRDAETVYRHALKIGATTLGADNPDYARLLGSFAELLRIRGQNEESEQLYRQALEIDRRMLGEDHPIYAYRLYRLYLVLRAQERHAEATPLLRRAIEISGSALLNPPAYADHARNYFVLLRLMGRYEQSEARSRKMLEMTGKSAGVDHPDYATRLDNLGVQLAEMGRVAEAEPLLRLALITRSNALGETHHDYARSLNNLGLLLWETGRSDEAEHHLRRSAGVLEIELGSEHPDTETVRGNLDRFLAERSD